MSFKSTNLIYLLVFVALFGYITPWILTPSNPLSLNAFDLAEWASLHPSQPNTSPPLVVPMMLRLQLVIISILLGLHAKTDYQRWGALLVIGLLALGQLPPLEFLINATDNINYQQQFILAAISLLVGCGLVVRSPKQWASLISIVLLAVGIFTSTSGLQQAQQLYTMSLQEHTIGNGIIITVSAYIGLIGLNCLHLFTTFRASMSSPSSEIKQGSH